MKDALGALTRNWVKPHIILGNKSPDCLLHKSLDCAVTAQKGGSVLVLLAGAPSLQ